MKNNRLRNTLQITKALADSQRIRILMLLVPGELCVCQIVEVLELAPSTVSKHLSIIAAADLVVMRKQGRWAYYRLPELSHHDLGSPILDWLRSSIAEDEKIQADQARLLAVKALDPEELCKRQRL